MENSTQESYLKSKNTTANHEYPYPIYVVAFSSSAVHHSNHRRLALGSFIEELSNQVDVVSFEDKTLSVTTNLNLSFDHPYPPTKLMFYPKPSASLLKSSDVIASSADFLHLWEVRDDSIDPLSVLNNSKSSEFFALLASFDWNEVETQQIGTSSIDMTCTIWDIEKEVVETQLIAHDKEVHDISWDKAKIFAFVFANGSVRIFDLRDKEHSTIIYESQQPDTPLLRLAWNKVVILVIRSLTVLVAEL